MYILKFKDSDCWIAPWNGDPGRTLVRDSAKTYKDKKTAEREAKKIIEKNAHRKFDLVVVQKVKLSEDIYW